MKNTFRIITLFAILHASSAFAASGVGSEGISLIGWIFIGFLAVIFTLQLIPSLLMFGSMMMAIFGKASHRESVIENGKSNNS